MLFRGGEPDTVIVRVVRLVTQDENDLFADVNGKTAEHRSGSWRKRSEAIEYKLVRDGLALLDGQGFIQGQKDSLIADLSHTDNSSIPTSIAGKD